MKYMTPKAIAALETALEMRASGKNGAEISRYLGMKHPAGMGTVIAVLKRIGANVPEVQRGMSKSDWAEFQQWKAWKAQMESQPRALANGLHV